MPFVARCDRCNHYVWANTRFILNIMMEQHDIDSHDDLTSYNDKQYPFWHILRVSHTDYSMLCQISKLPKFWETIRQPIPQ